MNILLKNFKINDFFFNIKLKKQPYKKINKHLSILIKSLKNTKLLSHNLIINKKLNFINYFIYINFNNSNCFLNIVDALNNELYFFSIGSIFNQLNKKKLKPIDIFNKFLEILLTKFSYLKHFSLALFINSTKINLIKLFLNKIKNKFLLIIFKIYTNYSFNGCKKEKWLSGLKR